MNCEHETLVGDTDLLQLLIAEGNYILHASFPAFMLDTFYSHVREYVPLMSEIYLETVLESLTSLIKFIEEDRPGDPTVIDQILSCPTWKKLSKFVFKKLSEIKKED